MTCTKFINQHYDVVLWFPSKANEHTCFTEGMCSLYPTCWCNWSDVRTYSKELYGLPWKAGLLQVIHILSPVFMKLFSIFLKFPSCYCSIHYKGDVQFFCFFWWGWKLAASIFRSQPSNENCCSTYPVIYFENSRRGTLLMQNFSSFF